MSAVQWTDKPDSWDADVPNTAIGLESEIQKPQQVSQFLDIFMHLGIPSCNMLTMLHHDHLNLSIIPYRLHLSIHICWKSGC